MRPRAPRRKRPCRWVVVACASLSLWSVSAVQVNATSTLGANADEADIVVGCLFPMSGRAGNLGRDSVIGVKLGLRYIAQIAGDDWPKLRVVLGDTKSKPSASVALAEKMIQQDKAQFLCGVVNSSVAIKVSEVAKRNRVFFIGTDHASSRLTGAFLHDTYFRVSNNTKQSMTAGALYVKERFAQTLANRPLKISYMGPDYEYGYQVWADFRAALDKFKVPYHIVSVLWPRLNEPDYSPYINHLIGQKPDLVVNSLWGGDIVAFVTQAIETEFFKTIKFANFEKGADYEIFSKLGDKMPLGLFLSSRHHNNWPETELNTWFVSEFYKDAGYYPSSGAEGAFSGVLAIAQAAQNVGAPYRDRTALIEALENLTMETPEDPAGFQSTMDAQTHQVKQVIAVGETVRNEAYPPATVMLGKWRVYYPHDLE